MHRAQQQVRDFHRAMDVPAPRKGLLALPQKRVEFRLELIREEFEELKEAFAKAYKYSDGSVEVTPDQIDALCDLLYVTYGTAVEMGLDLEPFFELVQEANMKKTAGPLRADGKKLKPPGWEAPDHGPELRRQREDV